FQGTYVLENPKPLFKGKPSSSRCVALDLSKAMRGYFFIYSRNFSVFLNQFVSHWIA
ncbi:unnamed protein product, partial [marine sediment metagenome]